MDAAEYFGHRPEEKVFKAIRSRPPTVRVRVANVAAPLEFEPEGPEQPELSQILKSAPPPKPPLDFELDEGEPQHQTELDYLTELAAERTVPQDAKAGLPPQAEPKSVEGPTPETLEVQQAVPPAPARKGWISVFLSDAVAPARRRRRSTIFAMRGILMGSSTARSFARAAERLKATYQKIDAITSRARIPLANAFWAVTLTALAWAMSLPAAWALAFLGICLLLTIAGQPARNLLAFAGVLLSSAAIAEIVRQRERFLEIFLSLLE